MSSPKRIRIRASLVPLFLAVAVTAAFTAEPCVPLPVAGASYDATTGDFNIRRPTSGGDLLFCGVFGSGETRVRAHLLGSADIWELVSPATASGEPILVTITFGALGSMSYDWEFPSGNRTVTSSSVANCSALADSPLRWPLEETLGYFTGLVAGSLGTEEELDLALAMVELLAEYVTSPDLLTDCANALVHAGGSAANCAVSSCTQGSCGDCCDVEFGLDKNDCDALYKDSWWGWMKRKLALGNGSANQQHTHCMNRAYIKYDQCNFYCSFVPLTSEACPCPLCQRL